MTAIEIAGRTIGGGHPVFVIAEAGVNHNGDRALALRLVDAAADAGADAVKFQSFVADRVVSSQAPKADYQRRTTPDDESHLAMLRRLELDPAQQREVRDYCRSRGIMFLSTPFDQASVDVLDVLGVPAFKISSGDLANLPLLEYVVGKGKPILLSTGMAYLSEVDEAVRTIREAGGTGLALLHCVTEYPAPAEAANLRAIQTLAAAFGVPVGYSDHTLGIEVGLAAVALGAVLIEKHVTLDRSLPGPDHAASLEPQDLRAFVAGVRTVEAAFGSGRKIPSPGEMSNRLVTRRSLAAATDLPRGTVIASSMLSALRPADGIPPAALRQVTGRRLRRNLAKGVLLQWGDLD